jgi:hypothetical protein
VASHHGSSWTQRTTEQDYPPPAADTDDIEHLQKRQVFHNPQISHGASHGLAAHWIHLIGGLLPLALSECIPEPAKYRKATRIASIGTTLAYEVLYTANELQRRKKQEEKLAECRSQTGHCER